MGLYKLYVRLLRDYHFVFFYIHSACMKLFLNGRCRAFFAATSSFCSREVSVDYSKHKYAVCKAVKI